MKLDHIMEGGLHRWAQVTHGQHQTHLVSCPDPTSLPARKQELVCWTKCWISSA